MNYTVHELDNLFYGLFINKFSRLSKREFSYEEFLDYLHKKGIFENKERLIEKLNEYVALGILDKRKNKYCINSRQI